MEVKEPYLPPLSPFPSLRSISSSSDSSEQLIEHRWWMGVDWWQIAGRLIDTAVSLRPPSLRSPPPAFLVTAQKSIKVQIVSQGAAVDHLNSKILCKGWLTAVYNHILPIYLLQYVVLKNIFPWLKWLHVLFRYFILQPDKNALYLLSLVKVCTFLPFLDSERAPFSLWDWQAAMLTPSQTAFNHLFKGF